MENSEMSEICLFFQILTVVITQDLKTTKIWTERKTERLRYELKEKIKISEISKLSILTYTQIENSKISEILFTSNFDTGCNSRFKTTSEKWSETKTKRFRYDLEQKQKFPRFLSFRFHLIPKIENSEI